MKIYTKKGDQGYTSLFSGKKVPKNHPIIEVLGCIDECNSALGVALSFFPTSSAFKELKDQLLRIQHTLFELGAILASSPPNISLLKTQELEQWIDDMQEKLPPLQHFILPNGHTAASTLQLARAVCRRAERALVVDIENKHAPLESLAYLNRLSDYLFMAARFVNFLSQTPEMVWLSKDSN